MGDSLSVQLFSLAPIYFPDASRISTMIGDFPDRSRHIVKIWDGRETAKSPIVCPLCVCVCFFFVLAKSKREQEKMIYFLLQR